MERIDFNTRALRKYAHESDTKDAHSQTVRRLEEELSMGPFLLRDRRQLAARRPIGRAFAYPRRERGAAANRDEGASVPSDADAVNSKVT